jgi:hypothetical protein
LKYSSVDFDFLCAGAIESTEEGEDTGFLSCTAGAVYEEVREVGRCGLEYEIWVSQDVGEVRI